MVYTKARRDRASVVNGEGLALDLEDLEVHLKDVPKRNLVHNLKNLAKIVQDAVDKS